MSFLSGNTLNLGDGSETIDIRGTHGRPITINGVAPGGGGGGDIDFPIVVPAGTATIMTGAGDISLTSGLIKTDTGGFKTTSGDFLTDFGTVNSLKVLAGEDVTVSSNEENQIVVIETDTIDMYTKDALGAKTGADNMTLTINTDDDCEIVLNKAGSGAIIDNYFKTNTIKPDSVVLQDYDALGTTLQSELRLNTEFQVENMILGSQSTISSTNLTVETSPDSSVVDKDGLTIISTAPKFLINTVDWYDKLIFNMTTWHRTTSIELPLHDQLYSDPTWTTPGHGDGYNRMARFTYWILEGQTVLNKYVNGQPVLIGGSPVQSTLQDLGFGGSRTAGFPQSTFDMSIRFVNPTDGSSSNMPPITTAGNFYKNLILTGANLSTSNEANTITQATGRYYFTLDPSYEEAPILFPNWNTNVPSAGSGGTPGPDVAFQNPEDSRWDIGYSPYQGSVSGGMGRFNLVFPPTWKCPIASAGPPVELHTIGMNIVVKPSMPVI